VTGRPTKYNADIAAEICTWLAEGKSLRSYCRQRGKPALSSVCLWIVTHDAFSEQYKRAREAAGYAHADSIAELAELVQAGKIEPNAARVAMDGRKWSAERMAPKTHMPQSLVNHQSPDGSMTPKPALDLSGLPSDALEAIVKAADGQADD